MRRWLGVLCCVAVSAYAQDGTQLHTPSAPTAGEEESALGRMSTECTGGRQSIVDQVRRLSRERVESAARMLRPDAHPPTLADGTQAENSAKYTLYIASMLFGYCPHTPGNFQPVKQCVAQMTDERRAQILRRIVEVMGGMHRSLRETPIACVPTHYPRCTVVDEITDDDGHVHQETAELRKAFTMASLDGAAGGPRTIYLCPQNFQPFSAGTSITLTESLTRDVVHESAHVAGVVVVPEHYCSFYDCNSSCFGDDEADAWMHLVSCMSGHRGTGPQ